jgi:hypothetical protein
VTTVGRRNEMADDGTGDRSFEVRPVTPERWADLEELFGPNRPPRPLTREIREPGLSPAVLSKMSS